MKADISRGLVAVVSTNVRSHTAACGTLTVVAALWLERLAFKGWIAHDEGALAQSAHRFLQHQIPHRDFTELYTGGLTLLHAAAFRLLGESLVTPRRIFLVAAIASVPLIYYIASRFARPWPAAFIAFAAFTWSFPNYPAPLPSWYNLIFAVGGSAALLRYVEDGRTRWLWLAGLCGGLSIVVKVVGLFFVAAGLLCLILYLSTDSIEQTSSPGNRGAWLVFALSTCACLAVGPLLVVGGNLGAYGVVILALPATLAALVVARAAIDPASTTPALADIARVIGPFAGGVAIPVGVFLAVFAYWHALLPLWDGVFVRPQRRIEWASFPGPTLWTLALAIPCVHFVVLRGGADAIRLKYPVALMLALAGFGAALMLNRELFDFVWSAVRMSAAPTFVASLLLFARRRGQGRTKPSVADRSLLTVVIAASWIALVQFPFAAPIYFAYSAPLAILAGCALASVRNEVPLRVKACGLAAVTFLGLCSRRFMFNHEMPTVVLVDQPSAVLASSRGGLRVSVSDSSTYATLDSLVHVHAGTSSILAEPDAPEVYFLTARENSTRMLFDFLEDSVVRETELRQAVQSRRIGLVVLNDSAWFWRRQSAQFLADVRANFPMSARAGKFEVRWRE